MELQHGYGHSHGQGHGEDMAISIGMDWGMATAWKKDMEMGIGRVKLNEYQVPVLYIQKCYPVFSQILQQWVANFKPFHSRF